MAYVAHDRVLSEPILREFAAQTGIKVRAVYDIEANKTVGLTNRLIAEAAAPRADVFWNNEVIQTIRLQSRGVAALEPLSDVPVVAPPIADARLRWVGFAARARVLLLNTAVADRAAVPAPAAPGLWDLASLHWRGRVAVANPRFGTTGTHFAVLLALWGEAEFRRWLKSLRDNGVSVVPGNAQVRDDVVSGRCAAGLTDTDDAVEAISSGAPVRIVFPDQSKDGTLLIPNTVAMVAHAPHARAATRLAAYLLSRDVESALARGRSAQIPINHPVPAPEYFPPRHSLRTMKVDFRAGAAKFEQMLALVEQEWP